MKIRLPRLAAKTITYGLMHLVVAITVAYALTRNWGAALAIGVTEPIVQTFAFAAHERLWARFGRRPASAAET
jgi:uncharacterized membrane protein